MVTTVIIAIVCFAVGGGLSYMLFRYGLKSKYDIIIKEAQTEAEVIKKNKLLEVKEKFLNKTWKKKLHCATRKSNKPKTS